VLASQFRVKVSAISSRFVESIVKFNSSIVAGFCDSKMSASNSSKVLALLGCRKAQSRGPQVSSFFRF
jgi:hypothetical protein